MIAENLITLFDGNNADIPDGFVRDTRFDGRMPKGSLTDLAGTGGSATHTHSSSAHTHVTASHSHTGDANTSEVGYSSNANTGSNISGSHRHSVNIAAASYSGNNLSNAVTYASATNVPPSYEFIFIKSTKLNLLPPNACILTAQSSRKELAFHSGSADKYIVGAPTNGNAGGSVGSANHAHSLNHTHTAVSHTHTVQTGSYAGDLGTPGTGGLNPANHSHTVTMTQSLTGNAYSGNCPDYDNTVEARSIYVYKNETEVKKTLAVGDIFLTTEATNPLGYVTCNGENGTQNLTDLYIKNPASASATIETTGSNTHSHAASNSHSHSHSHNHGGTVTTSTVGGPYHVNGGGYSESKSHNHTVGNISTVTQSWGDTTIASNSSNNEPPYIKARFVMATSAALGSFYFNLMAAMA